LKEARCYSSQAVSKSRMLGYSDAVRKIPLNISEKNNHISIKCNGKMKKKLGKPRDKDNEKRHAWKREVGYKQIKVNARMYVGGSGWWEKCSILIH